MTLLKKYWIVLFVIAYACLAFLVISPLKDQHRLYVSLTIDFMLEEEGDIDRVDPVKYCAFLHEISTNKSASCKDNLNYWRQEYLKDRVKINAHQKPEKKLNLPAEKLERKIEIYEWISWGLIGILLVSVIVRRFREDSASS